MSAASAPAPVPAAPRRPAYAWALGLAAVAGAIAYPLPFQASGVVYFQTVGFLVFLYAGLGVGWNIIGGWCGQFDFGPMVFFGTGAYTLAAVVKFLGLNPWLGFAIAAAATMLFAAAVTFPITRLRGHYFAIATNAIWLIALPIATNWESIGGSRGLFIPLVRSRSILGQVAILQPNGRVKELVFYYLALAYCALVLALAARGERTKLGYCFKAVRDDEEGAQALGIPTRAFKVIARCFTAGIYAIGGGIFAMWALSVFPDQVFDFNWGLLPTIAVVLGGIGRLWGPLLGCVILIPISQLISTYLGTGPLAGRGIDLIVYGLLIMFVAAARPQGLLSLPWRRWLRLDVWPPSAAAIAERPVGGGRAP